MNSSHTLQSFVGTLAVDAEVSTALRIGLLVAAYAFGMLVGETALAIGLL